MYQEASEEISKKIMNELHGRKGILDDVDLDIRREIRQAVEDILYNSCPYCGGDSPCSCWNDE